MSQIRVTINGAAGRMGRRLIALGADDPEIDVVAVLESPGHPRVGEDAGVLAGIGPLGVTVSDALQVETHVMIDFSLPAGAEAAVDACLQNRIPLVCATTGLNEDQAAKLHGAAEHIPILWAPNMSLAVNLGMKLTEVVAGALADKDADVEIIERHHRFKEDSPSGTALKFGRIISDVMGQTIQRHGRRGRPGVRPHGEIGFHAIRVGDNPGEHTIIFALLGETVEVTVRATSRDCYAMGALAAAKYLVDKPPGTYGINDVLGL